MKNITSGLPFDTLRPFKSQPEDFTPRDTLPWETLAQNVINCGLPEQGFGCLSSTSFIETSINWLADNLNLSPQATILDIGCGPGLYCRQLAQRGYQVTGIDIAPTFLAYAQQHTQNLPCTYRHLSMFELDFMAEFDMVLLINSVAKRLTESELDASLRQIKTALKPQGHLVGQFSMAPATFTSAEPIISEKTNFFQQSPWSSTFHMWAVRELTFPATREHVTHHLILREGETAQEYWSRFTLHPQATLTALLEQHGFQVHAIFGPQLGQPIQTQTHDCFMWASLIA